MIAWLQGYPLNPTKYRRNALQISHIFGNWGIKKSLDLGLMWQMAEREGFEPSIRFCRILTFQASAFDHSATAPHLV